MSNIEKKATRAAYGEFLVDEGARNQDLVVLDGDLSQSTMTAKFSKAYPERFFNMGIAEQNIFGTAAGLALSGKVVCASTFAMFASGRAFEIIRNSIGYTGANVKVCATHSGITVGEDGASHQTFEDIALMRTIPGMKVVVPSDAVSAKKLLGQAVADYGPYYIRLGRSAVPIVYDENTEIKIGKANTLREGTDYTIIACGIMVGKALEAAEMLASDGISARVVDMHTIKPLDGETLQKAAKETGGIVVAEEHSVLGGLYGAVSEYLSQHQPTKMLPIGQNDTFGESGKPDALLEKYGMTAENIVAAIKSF